MLIVLSAAMTVANGDSAEPDNAIRDPRQVEAALSKCEEIAKITTSAEVRYAALRRGSCYAFRIAEPTGDRSSDLARRGLELAERARKIAPERVEGHYRFALCLGIYLRENTLSGLTRVDDLIEAAKR